MVLAFNTIMNNMSVIAFQIIWLSIPLIMNVPDDGYYRNAPCAPNWISTPLLKFFIHSKSQKIRFFSAILARNCV